MSKYYAVYCDKVATAFVFTEKEEKEAAQVFNALTTITNAILNLKEESAYILYPIDSNISFFEWAEDCDEIFCRRHDSIKEIFLEYKHIIFNGECIK